MHPSCSNRHPCCGNCTPHCTKSHTHCPHHNRKVKRPERCPHSWKAVIETYEKWHLLVNLLQFCFVLNHKECSVSFYWSHQSMYNKMDKGDNADCFIDIQIWHVHFLFTKTLQIVLVFGWIILLSVLRYGRIADKIYQWIPKDDLMTRKSTKNVI